ncbi:hypothetical protein FRB96_002392 [Tulasnella sp. 330]|nr:hypothetical protein FRB96_002392 [Tulasnella sp. 330]KAG8883093.1 hypothetical protein FRB97_007230 [Tulasnella sp. 331]
MSESDLSSYQAQRDALIAQDRALRFDHQSKHTDPLGAKDLLAKADATIRQIRREENESVWSKETEDVPNIYPGMKFLTAKKTIEKTKLFQAVKRLPKGALLHAHMDAMCDARFLLKEALKHDQMHVRTSTVISADSLINTPPVFSALPLRHTEGVSSLTLSHPEYIGGDWVPIQRARDGFPVELGGPEGFDRWVISTLMIDPKEAYEKYNTSKKIWGKFGSTFNIARGLLGFEPVLEAYFRELLLSSINDGISYVEVRINFLQKTMIRANGEDNFEHREWLQCLQRVIGEVQQQMKESGREDEFVGAKVIYTTLRFLEIDQIGESFDDCIALKKEFPHLIAGYDLVGQEDVLYPLKHYLPKLLEFQHRVKAEGLSIPFIFHAGETLGDGDKVDDNLYDAILLGTKRIGHGFSLVKHPHLMKLCRERGITLEVCPISNEILRLTSTMPMHPLPMLLNNGVPVALACDDPSVFGNLGLSYDFFQVLVASEITGLVALGVMARESILSSSLEDEEKVDALAKWDRRWKRFLDELIQKGF